MRFVLCFFLYFILSISFAAERLIVEPDAGRGPLLTEIEAAKSSIDLVIYGFTDARLISSLVHAKRAGKHVQILLEKAPYHAETENDFAFKKFHNANIEVFSPNPEFQLTHQKTLLIDHHQAIVMTFNFTHSTFRDQRNFALVIDDPSMVEEIYRVFLADAEHKDVSVKNSNLIWSPNNSREKILNFINSAKSDIKIYAQDISDYQVVGALAKGAREGKSIKIIMPSWHPKNGKLKYLKRAGVEIYFNKVYDIHAKVIIVDHKKAILGSINLTKPSLDNNRELSVITSDPKVIQKLSDIFDEDLDQ